MVIEKREFDYSFPYLMDETQSVARDYRAACTPDFFLYKKDRTLIYRGQLDSARPGNEVEPNGEDLRKALDLGPKGGNYPRFRSKIEFGLQY